MANKLTSVPRRAKLPGHPGMALAYITPEEAAMLAARDRMAAPSHGQHYGPQGIPAYPEPGAGAGNEGGFAGFGGAADSGFGGNFAGNAVGQGGGFGDSGYGGGGFSGGGSFAGNAVGSGGGSDFSGGIGGGFAGYGSGGVGGGGWGGGEVGGGYGRNSPEGGFGGLAGGFGGSSTMNKNDPGPEVFGGSSTMNKNDPGPGFFGNTDQAPNTEAANFGHFAGVTGVPGTGPMAFPGIERPTAKDQSRIAAEKDQSRIAADPFGVPTADQSFAAPSTGIGPDPAPPFSGLESFADTVFGKLGEVGDYFAGTMGDKALTFGAGGEGQKVRGVFGPQDTSGEAPFMLDGKMYRIPMVYKGRAMTPALAQKLIEQGLFAPQAKAENALTGAGYA